MVRLISQSKQTICLQSLDFHLCIAPPTTQQQARNMATISPTRPSRRAATRKKVVVDSSEEEDFDAPKVAEDEDAEEDFTPAPQRSPKRASRRTTTGVPSTPKTAARTRRARTGESIEPSQIFDPNETTTPIPESPTKKASPRKRKSAAPSRKGRATVMSDVPQLPTPQPSATPEPSQLHGTPLGDITSATLNQDTTVVEGVKQEVVKVKPMETVLEKPMDIVVRTRALAKPAVPESTGPRSRTVIQYLVLTNFKSYAGRQEVGPFHVSFSSVVGPNGSGKSNVIDSLLFVFGFRASKMRQGKISALIHKSAMHPDPDFCEVEVHFQEVVDLVCFTELACNKVC